MGTYSEPGVGGTLWSLSAMTQPMPLSAGALPRNTLLSVSAEAQPVHVDEMMFTAVTLPWRMRSSSGAKPSPPITCSVPALAPSDGAMPSCVT